jgi:hypothetical protein
MAYRGHVRNGVVELDEPASLPEGAEVSVELATLENPTKRLSQDRLTPKSKPSLHNRSTPSGPIRRRACPFRKT